MFTRKDYIQGKCSHAEYYAQLVRSSNAKYLVEQRFGLPLLKDCYRRDKDLNNIELGRWDCIGVNLRMDNPHVWDQLGDYPTPAGHVCILKRAAEMLVNEED